MRSIASLMLRPISLSLCSNSSYCWRSSPSNRKKRETVSGMIRAMAASRASGLSTSPSFRKKAILLIVKITLRDRNSCSGAVFPGQFV